MAKDNSQALLGSASGNVRACLDILHQAASRGTRAKPTVAELNDILGRLQLVDDLIHRAAGQST